MPQNRPSTSPSELDDSRVPDMVPVQPRLSQKDWQARQPARSMVRPLNSVFALAEASRQAAPAR